MLWVTPRPHHLIRACFTQLLTCWSQGMFEHVSSRPTIPLQPYRFLGRQDRPFRVQGNRLNPSRKTLMVLGKKQSVILTSLGSRRGGPQAQRNGSSQGAETNKLRLSFFAFQTDKENPSPWKASSAGFDVLLPSGTALDKRGRQGQGAENKEGFPGLLIILLLCK